MHDDYDPKKPILEAFLPLTVWSVLRISLYTLVGVVLPGWMHAAVVLRALDKYTNLSAMNASVYFDLRYEQNVRALEDELRRLRRGGELRAFELPHDFPSGSQALIREVMA